MSSKSVGSSELYQQSQKDMESYRKEQLNSKKTIIKPINA
jgi:hypothetical protein